MPFLHADKGGNKDGLQPLNNGLTQYPLINLQAFNHLLIPTSLTNNINKNPSNNNHY